MHEGILGLTMKKSKVFYCTLLVFHTLCSSKQSGIGAGSVSIDYLVPEIASRLVAQLYKKWEGWTKATFNVLL